MKPLKDMPRVAVTGASGFIGRHVINELERNGAWVIAMAREKKKDLPVLTNGRWIFFDHSQSVSTDIEDLGQPDALIHLAWQGLPNYQSLHHFENELPNQYHFLKRMLQLH